MKPNHVILILLAAVPLLLFLALVFSPYFRQRAGISLCFWLFLLSLALASYAGLFGGGWLAFAILPQEYGGAGFIPRAILALPFTLPIVAVLTFQGLYRGLALRTILDAERDWKMEMAKPSIRAGIICSAISPFVLLGLLAVLGK